MGFEDGKGDFERNRGSLYVMDNNLKISPRISDVDVSSGVAWTPDSQIMFYIDTLAFTVVSYAFDIPLAKLGRYLSNFAKTSDLLTR